VIPQGSVLHLPDELRARILEKPEGKLVSWETMLRQGKSWLGTQEVSVEAARGKPAEIDAIAAQLAQERRIMIAVNKGRPIAILQPAAAQEPSAEKPQNPTR
jgi:capsule polysaccharide export protein KpsE/RkpR